MRVAFSGTHRTGKSSLIEALAGRLPGYEVVDEPYRLLEDEGYEPSDPPVREDYERQLARSVEAIADAPRDALIDRCPLDFVAYLRAIGEDGEIEIEDWPPVDLIVFVPIEDPDRIAVASHEDRRLRRRVDELLRTLVLDDALG